MSAFDVFRDPSARRLVAAAVLGLGIAWLSPAANAEEGCSNPRALGIERVVEVDTTDGPLLGNLQYKQIDFLQPGEVVLTFDDGPSRQSTNRVLDALSAHCTKATFFMVGRMAVAEPDMVRKVASLGHTVGSHTWSHANQHALGSAQAQREIELGVSAISAALGKPIAPFFRFPYLNDPKSSIRHLESRNIGVFSIDVDSKDFQTRNAAVMKQRVFRDLDRQGKGIILFHDIQRSTATGIADVLDELKRRGFKIVHIVPKSGVTTLSEFDALARKELERRNAIAATTPLAPRSVVWQAGDGQTGDGPAAGRKTPGETIARPSNAPPTAAPAATTTATNSATTTATSGAPDRQQPHRTTAAERPRPTWKREEPSWQDQMFQHYR